ncbi:cadmium-translocating P-type ATPase [Arsenicitalea aurantiaca]|uniref:Cadmium-translocating P-type ATPase n=1 Tax=Arsenicitalea aurantiaca TaxID=1783274 RepID=A0A433XE82_9HYPH|nr:heavy metal translocating P-type ATPase [Arsenicitalea aurantiaca]RUT32402.1 cadmium-translocating P-type ATPase [Arsenicitalea aurantiaca]
MAHGVAVSTIEGARTGEDKIDFAGAELGLVSRDIGEGLRQTDLSVPTIHCAGCIARIERGLSALPEVVRARVNLSTKRVSVQWKAATAPRLIETLGAMGYEATPFTFEDRKDDTLSHLIRATAVAGFASMNVMILSVSVWSGAEGQARDVFHALSALIAFPALLYSGQIFYRSAWSALRHGRMNMDVPIVVGVALAFALSLYDTATSGPHAYFDAVITLVFFLLAGRTLDHMMRARARVAVQGLARLMPLGALRIDAKGMQDFVPLAEIEPGMRLMIPAGARIPVDATVEVGHSDVDRSMVNGESLPQPAAPGTHLEAGTMNLTGPLTVVAHANADRSFLAEMIRMMEAAETGRASYRRIADRVSDLYAPVVHLAALITFLAWLWIGADLHQAVTIAIAVLIVTCPCALGLAVPIVQVMAARRLFESGIMMREGSALERLEKVDTIVFDKTGTLTDGKPRLTGTQERAPGMLDLAARIAAHSSHPLSRALAKSATTKDFGALEVAEHPGLGLSARIDGESWRLGRPDWALSKPSESDAQVVLSHDGRLMATFSFDEIARPGARQTVNALKENGFSLEIVSGDAPARVSAVAGVLGIDRIAYAAQPAGKVRRLEALRNDGHTVLMVGDGLNDAPALAGADVSMAPANAADVGRNAADFVFLREDLSAVGRGIDIARRAGVLVRQNIVLAILYNVIAVPLAMFGFITPLIAAVAMSASSILVVANALRLDGGTAQNEAAPTAGKAMAHV